MSVIHLTKQQITSLITLGILIMGLIAALIAVRTIQELRKKAAVPGGPATVTVSPGSTAFTQGEPVTLTLQATIQTLPVDGFQVVAYFTGSLPTDFTFTPTTPTSLELAYQQLIPTPEGKQLQLAYVSQNPASPLQTDTPIILGNITFTSPSTGSMTITFDSTQSIITQNQTAQDILGVPQNQTYTFTTTPITPPVSPSPEPSPSPSPVPSPSLSPSPSPSAVVTPPDPSPVPLCNTADLNRDGVVNDIDRTILITDFFATQPLNPRSDLNQNGIVDIVDYSLWAAHYETSTGPCK